MSDSNENAVSIPASWGKISHKEHTWSSRRIVCLHVKASLLLDLVQLPGEGDTTDPPTVHPSLSSPAWLCGSGACAAEGHGGSCRPFHIRGRPDDCVPGLHSSHPCESGHQLSHLCRCTHCSCRLCAGVASKVHVA